VAVGVDAARTKRRAFLSFLEHLGTVSVANSERCESRRDIPSKIGRRRSTWIAASSDGRTASSRSRHPSKHWRGDVDPLPDANDYDAKVTARRKAGPVEPEPRVLSASREDDGDPLPRGGPDYGVKSR
jgi:hypothetical protein